VCDAVKRIVAIAVGFAACGESSTSKPDASLPIDAAADAGFGSTCTGPCQTTALVATMMATRTLNRAYFGVTSADNTLHVEAYLGGGTGCPTMNSPPPDYTLVLGRVAMPTSMTTISSPGNFLDLVGDMLPDNMLGQKADSVSLTPVAYQPGSHLALDASLVFPAGTVAGHLYATHCASLDEP
jgi:hypothetical protein